MTDKPDKVPVYEVRAASRMTIGQMLGELYTPAEAEIWLTSPQQIFGGMSPVQLIARGQDETVAMALRQIIEGAYT